MTKQIDLILNGKGGVGKSFFATNFVQTLKDRRLTHRAVDTDDENSTLLRFHADAESLNIEKPGEIDRLFALLESAELLVVDCRASSTDLFLDYFAEINLHEVLCTLDARMTLVSPRGSMATAATSSLRIRRTANSSASTMTARLERASSANCTAARLRFRGCTTGWSRR